MTKCDHHWEGLQHGERISDRRIERRWCVVCGLHQTRREVLRWGNWERLADIPVKRKEGEAP